MAGTKGINTFLVARYTVFGLFIICNAITCSVAVWNSSLVRSSQPSQVDVYLIFLGAFALVSIFTLIFTELLCANAMTTRIWFECTWVALFWIMELAGGAALIAIESDVSCSRQATTFLNTLCSSERVLLAFTWMCTIMLLIYLLALVFIVASQYHQDPRIWVSNVHVLRAVAVRPGTSSTTTSPLTTRFKRRASLEIYTPQPTRSKPVPTFHHLAGLSSEYAIEPFHPVFAAPEQMDVSYLSDLPEAIPLPPLPTGPPVMPSFMKPIPALPRDSVNVRSRSLSQPDLQRELPSSITYASPGLPPVTVPSQSSSMPVPSPLGDWPRQDVMQLPVKQRHKPPPPSAFEFPKKQLVAMASTDRASAPADTVIQPRPRRPSGPRMRVPSEESGHRPAPLDLTGISNYDAGRRDDAGLNV